MARHRRAEVQSERVEEEAPEETQGAPTTVLVRGRSAMPATQVDNKRWGHWRAGVHWPGTEMKEERVTIKQLDELKLDPNLSLLFDPSEEAVVRARTAPDEEAKTLAIEAAEAEIKVADLKARSKVAELQAAVEAETKALAAKRAQLEAMRAGAR